MSFFARKPLVEQVGPVWLEAITAPLAENACGEDPRYSDDFGTVKQEIDKLKGNDFAKVTTLCIDILSSRSKDLRVAGYLLLASTYVSGLDGLIDACHAYRSLLETFGNGCHPQKQSMCHTALGWLNNGKLETYVRQNMNGTSPAQLEELRSLIDNINTLINTTYGEEAPQWTSLDRGISSALKTLPAIVEEPVSQPEPATPQAVATPAAQETHAISSSLAASISSERELLNATRMLRDYLLQKNDLFRAIAYSRALRWGALQLPPHENSKTRIPAPRQSAINELQQIRTANAPEALLTLCENLFLEGPGHLLLDLQHAAFDAATAMGRSDLADFIADQAVALLHRLPELTSLQFENGLPFADMNTRSWIESQLTPADTQPLEQDDWTEQLDALLESARVLVRKKQLPAALGLFTAHPVQDAKQRVYLQRAKVRICLEGGRADLALPVIEELAEQLEQQSLHVWKPALSIDIWKLQLEASQACLKKSSAEEKLALAATISRLKRKICSTDLQAAARLL